MVLKVRLVMAHARVSDQMGIEKLLKKRFLKKRFKKFFSFICLFTFWLHRVFVAACSLFLAAVSGGCSLVEVCRRLIVVAPLVAEHRLSSCGSWALGHRLNTCVAWA